MNKRVIAYRKSRSFSFDYKSCFPPKNPLPLSLNHLLLVDGFTRLPWWICCSWSTVTLLTRGDRLRAPLEDMAHGERKQCSTMIFGELSRYPDYPSRSPDYPSRYPDIQVYLAKFTFVSILLILNPAGRNPVEIHLCITQFGDAWIFQ